MLKKALISFSFSVALISSAMAGEGAALIDFQSLSPDMAHRLVNETITACRAEGYQVSVAVVDRGGNLQALLRDQFAGPDTPETARLKARTALNFRTNTQELMEQTKAGSPAAGLRHLPGILVVGGGVTIEAAGKLVGALGVSGAPGGDRDEACALKGLEPIVEEIDF